MAKKEDVRSMFNTIAGKYDFLNHFLSLGTDILWRKKAIRLLKKQSPKMILDIATGTGDFAIEAMTLEPEKVIGIDISGEMLKIGREKIRQKKLQAKIELHEGDSENLFFADNTFDAVTVAFGVRNFENLKKGLSGMYRVLKKEGTVVVLEFSKPQRAPVKQLYYFYFSYMLPFIGKIISGHHKAYTYLPESVSTFPDGNDFLALLENAGFKQTKCISLSFGIASIYTGKKC